ncbi:MAG TPA: CDP-alcohol phosphatidyltransferase family protein [Gemmatimonadales bacterium]|nr:CDP-alcohol phosphatidyltransferase family protein [Gemmatimonadales bacterium]
MTATTAVILAQHSAGVRVAGLSNLDRLVLTALEAGLARIIILSDDPESARRMLRAGSFSRAELQCLRADSAAAGSALFALAAEPASFVLLRTDVVIDPQYVRRLLAATGPAEEAVLGVDSAWNWLGIGCLPPRFAARLAADPSRTAAELPSGEASRPLRPEPGFAVRLAGASDRRTAERALVRGTGKSSDGLVSRYLNRPVSRAISLVLIQLPVTPNGVTFFGLFLSLLSTWFIVRGQFVAGTLLIQLNSILDGCDGEIARAKFLASPQGERTDRLVDSAGNILFGVALPLGLYRMSENPLYLWLGAFLLLSVPILLALVHLNPRSEHYHHTTGRLQARFAGRPALAKLFTGVTRLFSHDSLALLALVLALLGAMQVFLYLIVVGTVAYYWLLLARSRATAPPSPVPL